MAYPSTAELECGGILILAIILSASILLRDLLVLISSIFSVGFIFFFILLIAVSNFISFFPKAKQSWDN